MTNTSYGLPLGQRIAYGVIGAESDRNILSAIQLLLDKDCYTVVPMEAADVRSCLINKVVQGVIVLRPHKRSIFHYCTEITDLATRVMSVNFITLDDAGKIVGHNADYHGIKYLLERHSISVEGKKIVVIGEGGTAAAVAVYMKDHGARHVEMCVTNRKRRLVLPKRTDIVVNATEIGGYPNNGKTPIKLTHLEGVEWLIDLVSNPGQTKLMMEAKSLGVSVVNGFDMELAQLKYTLEVLGHCHIDELRMDAARAQLRGETININLIGMPGSGKTTIGKLIAEKMGRQFIDVDQEITRYARRKPKDIILEHGEGVFRNLETEVLATISKQHGVVIATGGGVVTRDDNKPLLDQNGITIYIKRELEQLATEDRPLSESVPLEKILASREKQYEEWSYSSVDNKNIDTTVENVHSIFKDVINNRD